VEVLVSLLIPYAAWILADAVGASGALAVATTGLYVGQSTYLRLEAGTRLQATAFWDVLDFILEGLLFILVGLQLRLLGDVLTAATPLTLVDDIAALCLAAIVVRVAWSFGARWLTWVGSRLLHVRSARPQWRIVALVAWSGIRGADSLAPALALPLTIAGGAPFPDRDLIVFLVFATILVTLLLQGLSLATLARWLGIGPEDTGREEALARASMARAALARLDELAGQPWVPREDARQLRELYAHRAEHATARALEDWLRHRQASQRLRRAALDAERRDAVRLRDRGQISDDVLRRIERRLDLEEQGLEAG
jgi:CPA1 family monovalent cation:H+ antiporter